MTDCGHSWESVLGTQCPQCRQESATDWGAVALVAIILLWDFVFLFCAVWILT